MRPSDVDWLLTEFVRHTPAVRNAVVVSADGLCLAASPHTGVALGDQLSAAASGLMSLAHGAARLLAAGTVTQTILEMDGGYLFVTPIARTATLAVHADRRCDLGAVGYEMTMLSARVGHAMTPGPRSPAPEYQP